jgi:hypothetical protein
MMEFVNAGRSDKTPISVHRKPLVSNPCLAPPSQSVISYANSQKLGFAEWDEVRGGWIAYTIHLPQGWRSSVNVVEDCLIMPSKRGKGIKRDAPVDPVVEKASNKPAPSPKKTKARKKGKSTTSVSTSEKKSTTAPIEKPIESTVAPSKAKSVGASLSRRSQVRRVLFLVHRRVREKLVPFLLLWMRNNHLRLQLLHLLGKRSSSLPSFLLVLLVAQGVKVVLR